MLLNLAYRYGLGQTRTWNQWDLSLAQICFSLFDYEFCLCSKTSTKTPRSVPLSPSFPAMEQHWLRWSLQSQATSIMSSPATTVFSWSCFKMPCSSSSAPGLDLVPFFSVSALQQQNVVASLTQVMGNPVPLFFLLCNFLQTTTEPLRSFFFSDASEE